MSYEDDIPVEYRKEQSGREQPYEVVEFADEEGDRWLRLKLAVVAGKPIDKIPDGDYCYTKCIPEDKIDQWTECLSLHGEISAECFALWDEMSVTTRCPYQEWTKYGTVKCHFLEEESVGISKKEYKKALKHFGSEERLEAECQGSMLLGDAVRCCTRVLESIRKTKSK